MNGYVLAWMALSSAPSAAAGILLGRKIQHRDSYQSGLETGRMMAQYSQEQGGRSAVEVLEESRRRAAGIVGAHGHDGPCSRERGCW